MARKVSKGSTKNKAKTGYLKQKAAEEKLNRRMHQRGYEMWRAGLAPGEIQKRLHITRDTWDWLLKEGSSDLPSYEDLVIDEVQIIRNSASEAALELSHNSVKVLRDRMSNAGKANAIMGTILDRVASGSPFEELDAKALKALLPIANITSVAEAYARIYGTSAATRGLHPTVDHSKAEFVSPLESVQGKVEEDKTLIPPEQRDQVVSDVSGWTEEQLDQFIEGKGEPEPSEVQDT